MNILITGSGRGLGRHLCEQAARRGHTVLAGIRHAASEQDAAAATADRASGAIVPLALDVSDEASIREAAAKAGEIVEGLDAIVNNAGVLMAREQKLEQLDFDAVEASFSVNLFGPMKVMKHFLPLLERGRRQVVVNVSSEAGAYAGAYGGDYPYALTKAGLNYFSAQLRRALGGRGMQVFAVHPGWIRTDMGGGQAPGDPTETAAGILDLLERKTDVSPDAPVFIDHKGQPMPF